MCLQDWLNIKDQTESPKSHFQNGHGLQVFVGSRSFWKVLLLEHSIFSFCWTIAAHGRFFNSSDQQLSSNVVKALQRFPEIICFAVQKYFVKTRRISQNKKNTAIA